MNLHMTCAVLLFQSKCSKYGQQFPGHSGGSQSAWSEIAFKKSLFSDMSFGPDAKSGYLVLSHINLYSRNIHNYIYFFFLL